MLKFPPILAGSAILACLSPLVARDLHPSMIRAERNTGSSFTTDDEQLQKLYSLGMAQLEKSLSKFAPGMTILVEGGGYKNAWLETQPMGGEMYAKHDLQVALNNQVVFIRTQREDGRLPGMVLKGSEVAEKGWKEKGFPEGFVWVPKHDLVADYEMFQGYCFPEPAWRMYFWVGKNRDYLKQLQAALKGFDSYLWRTRDSNGDGILETWCVWDTGEDGSTRLHHRGARENWPFEKPPGSDAPGIPKLAADARIPFQSMDIMAYSYSGREVLEKISRELGDGEEANWKKAADEVRQRVIEKLWDPKRHACFDRDRDGKVLPELIHNNLRCMWYGMFTQEMADAFVKHHLLNPKEFWTPVPLVSIARNEELFLSKPRNNWSGQPQGLTYQRAIHALERYGHHAEVILLGRKLLPILMRNGKFSQQLDPDTGAASLSNSDGYCPMILAMQEYVTRMHGIHINVENGQVWWSGLSPASWGMVADLAQNQLGNLSFTQKWGERSFEMSLRRKGLLEARVNGKVVFTASPETRIITDLKGNLLSAVGIDSVKRDVKVNQQDRQWTGTISPNEVKRFEANKLVPDRRTPFDYPSAE